MRIVISILLITALSAVSAGESAKEKDRKAILAMAGSYVVDFHFEETVPFQIGYELKPAYDSAALEEVIVVENTENKIVLQHVLQTKRGIIKHWRQDWEFENRTLWEYKGHQAWTKRKLSKKEAKGTWTQRVFQVDDSPRYESLGRWTHVGSLSQWESNITNRPLPRRDSSKRDDYHILVARNRHALTQTGWVHEQDNYKLSLANDEQEVIVRERGLNTYSRTSSDRLSEARDWWEENKTYWADVRSLWDEIFARDDAINLQAKVDDESLFMHIFSIGEEALEDENYQSEVYKNRVRAIIDKYLNKEVTAATL